MWLSDKKINRHSFFFHWISLRVIVSVHNKTNWLTEVNIKVCAARLKSPDPRINLSFKRRVWNRLCGFPHRLTQRCTVGNRGEGGEGEKKWPFLSWSWLEVSDRQSALTWPRFKPPLTQDTPLRRHRADIFRRNERRVSLRVVMVAAKARGGQRGNGWGGIAASPLTPLNLFVSV